jgi:hypothetical protein
LSDAPRTLEQARGFFKLAASLKKAAQAAVASAAWEPRNMQRLALPSSPSIALARCSITARPAVLAAISGCWTGRF